MILEDLQKGDIVRLSDDRKIFGKRGAEIIGVQNLGRPAIIISNNIGNAYSTNVQVAIGTTKIKNPEQATHFIVSGFGLEQDTMFELESIFTIPKDWIDFKIGYISNEVLKALDTAIVAAFDVYGTIKTISKNPPSKESYINPHYNVGMGKEANFIDNLMSSMLPSNYDGKKIASDTIITNVYNALDSDLSDESNARKLRWYCNKLIEINKSKDEDVEE